MIYLACTECYKMWLHRNEVIHEKCLGHFRAAGEYDVKLASQENIDQANRTKEVVEPRIREWHFGQVEIINDKLVVFKDNTYTMLTKFLPHNEKFRMIIHIKDEV